MPNYEVITLGESPNLDCEADGWKLSCDAVDGGRFVHFYRGSDVVLGVAAAEVLAIFRGGTDA